MTGVSPTDPSLNCANEASAAAKPAESILLRRIVREMDNYLAQHVKGYDYDVEAGWAELERRIGSSESTQQTERKHVCAPPDAPDSAARLDAKELEDYKMSAQQLDLTAHPHGFLAQVLHASTGPVTHDAMEWFNRHRGPAVVYLKALKATPMMISSRNTNEFAARLSKSRGEERWLVSWMPEAALTRKQVYSVMVLNEILIAQDLDSGTMIAVMQDLAADVSLPLENILRRLGRIKDPAPRPRWLRAWDVETVDPGDKAADCDRPEVRFLPNIQQPSRFRR